MSKPYDPWDEIELDTPDRLQAAGIRWLIAPGLRVFGSQAFETIVSFAARGGAVLAFVDSFYFEPRSAGCTERVIETRLTKVFSPVTAPYMRSRQLVNGQMNAGQGKYGWLTQGFPVSLDYSRRYALAVLGHSPVLERHGSITASEFLLLEGKPDHRLHGIEVPAFIIHEYPSGGLFVYACTSLPLLSEFHIILKNFCEREPQHPFDVFLCHNSQDKEEVRNIAKSLQKLGLRPWLDEWELRPGLPWQRLLEQQIESIRAAAVCVGKNGVGPWQNTELDAFLRELHGRSCPVIPVLLSDCPNPPPLPVFLRGMTWVDFRNTNPDPLELLRWGITGTRENRDGVLLA